MNADILNILYAASLEFGEDWRRPLPELAKERLSHLNETEITEAAALIYDVRNNIEQLMFDNYTKINERTVSKDQIKKEIQTRYPWMNEENVDHGFSQGMYYAWHG